MTGAVLIVDALSAGSGKRRSSRDAIGCGPRTVAGVLEANGVKCRIRRAADALGTRRGLRDFQHLAISAMTMDMPVTQKLVNRWKHLKPEGRVIVGGPIAADARRLLGSLRPDLFVVGEGESTLQELIDLEFFEENVDLSRVEGIAYLESGKPVITQHRAPMGIEEWKSFSPSTVRIVDYPVYQASKVYVEVVRGCSNYNRTRIPLPDGRECSGCGNCDSKDLDLRADCPEDIPPGCGFCSVPSTWGPPRSRSEAVIVDEIRELMDLGVHRIVLEAPGFLDYMRGVRPLLTPCSPPANLDAVDSLLRAITSLPQFQEDKAHIAIENIKACLFNEEVAACLSKYLSTASPNIGIESGSRSHMHDIGKCGTPEDVISAVRVSSAYGMHPFVYFIYGLPGEDGRTVEESIQMMYRLSEAGAERIILYGFRALPGSAFAEFPEPRFSDPHGERLRSVAQEINRSKKAHYIGSVVRGIAAEPSWSRNGFTMVYPLHEGPLMTVAGGFSPGKFLDVKITDALSDGLLLGEVIRE